MIEKDKVKTLLSNEALNLTGLSEALGGADKDEIREQLKDELFQLGGGWGMYQYADVHEINGKKYVELSDVKRILERFGLETSDVLDEKENIIYDLENNRD